MCLSVFALGLNRRCLDERRVFLPAEGLHKRLQEEGKAHMERLAALRRLYIKCGALGLAQRALLYAKDELNMCTMRMRASAHP